MHIDASSRKLQARELCVAKRKQPLLSALLDTGGVVKIAEPLPASLAMALNPASRHCCKRPRRKPCQVF